jgi:hypothetical protein
MPRRVIVWVVFAYLFVHGSLALRVSQAQPPASVPDAPRASSCCPVDSFARERDSLMNVILAGLKGRENAPAESVFKNIRALKGMPAGRLARVMNLGYGRSLGVSCRHCHVVGEWDKEDKPQKQVTREMMRLVSSLNDSVLTRIKGLRSEKPTVNCTTCHRGARKPALNLD